MSRLFTIVTILLSFMACTYSQNIIPKRPFGYIFNGGSNDAPIHLDIHMGPLCPNSRDAFPVAKSVAMHYGATTLKLTLHMFPLPYHHPAYLTGIGAQVVRGAASSTGAYRWFDTIYANLASLSNAATYNMTTQEVIGLLGRYAQASGVDEQIFLAGMASGALETNTRAAWKYSCSRAISGTPTFLLNDVKLEADPTWTLADWQQVIDPLLKERTRQNESPSNKTCSSNTKKCDYLPGKVECCTPGENCIPDVGCRCFENGCNTLSETNKKCPFNTKECQFLPGKTECCTKGEACIPDVGCRCFDDGTSTSDCESVQMMEIKPII